MHSRGIYSFFSCSIFIALISVLVLESCSFKKGPCTYDEIRFKAEVVALTPIKIKGKEHIEVELAFNNSSLYGKKQTLNALKGIDIDTNFIKRNKLRVGKTYTGIVNETQEKHCTKMFVSFDQKLK